MRILDASVHIVLLMLLSRPRFLSCCLDAGLMPGDATQALLSCSMRFSRIGIVSKNRGESGLYPRTCILPSHLARDSQIITASPLPPHV